MPHDLVTWLWRGLILIVPPGVLGWRLLALMAQHSICLSAQRFAERQSTVYYRFAIQNNEDISLKGKRWLIIRILDDAGQFANEAKHTGGHGSGPPGVDDDLRRASGL